MLSLAPHAIKVIVRLSATVSAFLIVLILLYPILYVILASLMVGGGLRVSFSDLAAGLTLERYAATLRDPQFMRGVVTSLTVAFLHIVFAVLIITPAAYAFSRFKFKGKDAILLLYLILSQVGGGFGVAALIALYVLLLKINSMGVPVIGNPVVLALVYTSWAVPFQTWLIKNYFDALPRELDEAAFIDGASWGDIVFKVVLPASKPAMAVIAIFAFMGAWGEFIVASFLRVPTLAAYIYQTATGQTIFWGDFAARTILFSIPIIVLFIISQRYIGEAVKYGAGKI
ncbi:MAG: ABC transporter permease subunit [Thermoprotei archaeon]|nr:ABC transporter permease subunit [Thermoprotei archaeon]